MTVAHIPPKKTYQLHSQIINSRSDRNTKTKQKTVPKPYVVRGKEISISQSASPGQIIYGQMMVGGVYTFVDTNSDSRAYIVIGSSDSQVALQARAAGVVGNSITIAFTVSGTSTKNVVTVNGSAISVRLKSSSGTSTATAQSVVDSIKASGAAGALVSCNIGSGDGTGLCTVQAVTSLTGGGGTWLHQVITLACHEIDSVQELYLNSKLVTLGHANDSRWGTGIWDSKVFLALNKGSDSQSAQPDLVAQLPTKWTPDHRQAGCAHVYLITVWNQNLFADGGQPEATFKVRGKKVYDPRSGLTTFSSNAALIIADFLTNSKFGCGFSYSDIDSATLTAAANTCDETVSGEARYTINGVFDTDQNWEQVLTEMSAAIGGGDIVYRAGKWFIYPAKWNAPSMSLSEVDLRGQMNVETSASRSDKFNSVRGTFVNPSANHNETDFPVVTNSMYVGEDGSPIFQDIKFTLVTSAVTAQRLAKIELERIRQGISVVYPTHLGCVALQVSDTVYLSNTRYGWTNKTFEVRDVVLEQQDSGEMITTLHLKESGPGVFDWANGSETTLDISPNTTLPDVSYITAPTITLSSGTAELYFTSAGVLRSRLKVSWPLTTNIYLSEGGYYEVQFKPSAERSWSASYFVSGDQTFHYLTDVQDGSFYDVRVRAKNSFGYVSAWTTVTGHMVVGKTAPPSDVTALNAVLTKSGIFLSWPAVTDIDLKHYELRYGATWETATLIGRTPADGSTFLWNNLAVGTYRILIKAVDTSLNESTREALAKVKISGPAQVQGFLVLAISGQVAARWNSPVYPTPDLLPIDHYNLYRGTSFASATLIGTSSGTSYSHAEFEGNTFTYWIEAVDVAGNVSTPVSQVIKTSVPAGYSPIYSHSISNPAVVTVLNKIFCMVGGDADAPADQPSGIILPFGKRHSHIPGKIPDQWKNDKSGYYPIVNGTGYGNMGYLLAGPGDPTIFYPTVNWPGYFEATRDLGVTVTSGIVYIAGQELTWGDPVRLVYTISTSPDNSTWTTYAGTKQAVASSFRYIKYRIDFYPTSESSVMYLVLTGNVI